MTGEIRKDYQISWTFTSAGRHIVKYGVEWTRVDWSGLVKGGFVKGGFVKGGFVKHGFVKGGFVKGGFVKHDNLKLKRATRKVQIFFRADQIENRAGDNKRQERNSIERKPDVIPQYN